MSIVAYHASDRGAGVMVREPRSTWLQAVVSVDGGRGFVIETKDWDRLVVTAAHRLQSGGEPYLPQPHGMSNLEERTYANLLGPLGGELTVWAECLFVDPVADLAVLGSPDGQELYDEAAAYEALVEAAVPLKLGSLSFTPERHTLPDGTEISGGPVAESDAWPLALSGQWFGCRVMSRGRSLWISKAAEGIRGGMSGSPIIAPNGRAIGVLCTSSGVVTPGQQPDTGDHREGGPNPYLPANLPGWLACGMCEP